MDDSKKKKESVTPVTHKEDVDNFRENFLKFTQGAHMPLPKEYEFEENILTTHLKSEHGDN